MKTPEQWRLEQSGAILDTNNIQDAYIDQWIAKIQADALTSQSTELARLREERDKIVAALNVKIEHTESFLQRIEQERNTLHLQVQVLEKQITELKK